MTLEIGENLSTFLMLFTVIGFFAFALWNSNRKGT